MDPIRPTVVYLSNQQQGLFNLGKNFSHDFTNYLVNPVCAPDADLEIGIRQIIYTPKKQEQKFFEHDIQNKISVTVIPAGVRVLTFKKVSEVLEDFLMYVNSRLTTLFSVNASITRRYVGDEEHPKINNNTASDLIIPLDLSYALGFNGQTVFEAGETLSSLPFNQKLFSEIPSEKIIEFKLSPKDRTSEVSVNEPNNYTLEGLVEEINAALHNFELTLSISPTTTTIAAKNETNTYRIEFSAKMRDIFDFPHAIYISQVPYTKNNNISFEPERDIICVGCDIVEPSIMGSHYVNFLAMFKQSDNYGKMEVVDFNPIIYYPVSRSFVQSIQIRLTDPNLNHFNLGSERVLVTLIIRQRR